MGRVALPVVRLAAPLGAVGLARQFPDFGRRAGRPQEGGQFVGQAAHGRHADQPVAGVAPGGDDDGRRHDGYPQGQGGEGDGETLHDGHPDKGDGWG